MLWTFWQWVRKQTREAMLAGVSDAVDALTQGGATEDVAQIADRLRGRLAALAPPPPIVELTPDVPAEEPATNGRRRKAT